MSFFSSVVGAVKKVGKVATLPITAPLKLQAQLASKLLPVVARAIPGPSLFGRSSGSSSSAPAAPTGWRGTSLIAPALRASPPSSSVSYDSGSTTPAQSSWFPSIAAAVSATPPAPSPAPYYPGAAPAPYVPGGVAGGTPLSYAQPGYQPSSGGSYGGGYGGGSYGGGGGYDDGIDVPDDGSVYAASTDADVYDQDGAELADLNAYAQLADNGLGEDGQGLGDWKSALTNIVKGAASGALTQTVSALTPKPAAPKPGLLSGGGMSTGAKVAIGVAIAAPLAYLALRHRAAPARARNPRRRRRRSRRR